MLSCQYTDVEWNSGAADGFWYDRKETTPVNNGTPTISAPSAIPQYGSGRSDGHEPPVYVVRQRNDHRFFRVAAVAD